MLLSEGQRGSGQVVKEAVQMVQEDGVDSSPYALLVKEICQACKEILDSIGGSFPMGGEERARLQMACSFLLLCRCEDEIGRLVGRQAAEMASEALRYAIAGRSCGALFPDAQGLATVEYFLLLYDANFQLCRAEMTGAGVSAAHAMRQWLHTQNYSLEVVDSLIPMLEEVWRSRCEPLVKSVSESPLPTS